MYNYTCIIVDWHGPYDFNEIKANPDWCNGIYLATGTTTDTYENSILYCGITENNFYDRFKNHHKIHIINNNKQFWVGKIVYPIKYNRATLELAEKIIVYFWKPKLNDRKKISVPEPVTLINKWYKKNHSPRFIQHKTTNKLHDVLSWDGELWRTGNLTILENV